MAFLAMTVGLLFSTRPAFVKAEDSEPPPSAEGTSSTAQVEEAVEQMGEKVERGLASKYELEFGDSDDWVQFTTGEWVRGKLRSVRPKGIEAGMDVVFYSRELDSLTFSWGDVAALHSPSIKNYVFKQGLNVVGKAMIVKDQVIIETQDGIETYPRDELMSISEGSARERTWWSSELNLGFSANAGNTSQGSLTTEFGLMRNDGFTLAYIDYQGTVGYVDRSLNVNRHLTVVNVAVFLWDRGYLVPMLAQLLYDEFQNFKMRATPAVGAGVYLFKKAKERKNHTNQYEWDLQGGLGYQYVRFISAFTGVRNPQNDGFVMLRTYWKLKFLGGDVTFTVDWQTNLVYTGIGSTNHTGKAKFSTEITDVINTQISFLFLRTRDPEPRSDGTVPKQNDYQVVVGFGFTIH